MKTVRFKHFLRERSDLSTTGDETLLSVSEYYGVKPRSEAFVGEEFESRAATLEGYRRVSKNNFVMNYMLAWKGAYGVSDFDGIVSPAYSVFEVDQRVVDVRYLHHRTRSDDMKAYFRSRSKGIIESRLRLYPDNLLAADITLPDLTTQRQIADFLDRETARIDLLIEKKQRMVELLGDEWASTVESSIAHSGPQSKLGHHIEILSGYAFPSADFSDDPSDVRLLRGINVNPGQIRWDETVYWPVSKLNEVRRFVLRSGDVVLGMDRPWISSGIRVAELTDEDAPSLLLQRVCRITARPSLVKKYMLLLLSSRRFSAYFEPLLTGVSVPHISPDQVKSFVFDYAPVEHQLVIVDKIGRVHTRLRATVQSVQLSITRLREYRSALITAAVTGQIDPTTHARAGHIDRQLDAMEAS